MGAVHLYAKIANHRRMSFSESFFDFVNQSLCVYRIQPNIWISLVMAMIIESMVAMSVSTECAYFAKIDYS